MRILRVLRNLHSDDSGQDLIEYALLAALTSLAAVTTVQTLAVSVNTALSKVASSIADAIS